MVEHYGPKYSGTLGLATMVEHCCGTYEALQQYRDMEHWEKRDMEHWEHRDMKHWGHRDMKH